MLKTKIFNHIMFNGSKQTSEKLFLKSLKQIQKINSKKKIEDIIKLGVINSSPIVYLKTIKRKRKQTIEFPFLLKNEIRLSYGLKLILNNCQSKKFNNFYNQLNLELTESSKGFGKNKLASVVIFSVASYLGNNIIIGQIRLIRVYL